MILVMAVNMILIFVIIIVNLSNGIIRSRFSRKRSARKTKKSRRSPRPSASAPQHISRSRASRRWSSSLCLMSCRRSIMKPKPMTALKMIAQEKNWVSLIRRTQSWRRRTPRTSATRHPCQSPAWAGLVPATWWTLTVKANSSILWSRRPASGASRPSRPAWASATRPMIFRLWRSHWIRILQACS